MPTLPTLLLFVVAVLGLMVSPGPNMALVVSQGLAHGAWGGIASAAGIFIADLVMTLLVCAGIAGLVSAWAPAFDVLRYAGAIYLAWLALQAWRRRNAGLATDARTPMSPRRALQSAIVVSLLNPKALLFFLVFLPQFVDRQRGSVTSQLLVFGLLLSVIALLFHGALGLCAGHVAAAFRRRARPLQWLDRLQSAVLLGLAIRLLFLERTPRP